MLNPSAPSILNHGHARQSPQKKRHQPARFSVEVLERRDLLVADIGENALSCADLTSLNLPDTVISRSGQQGGHCLVSGVIEETIKFDVRLPSHDNWNGKFLMSGNGGFAGSKEGNGALGLQRGYATAATDTGHSAAGIDGSWALNNRKAQEDYGYRGVHLTAVVAKSVIRNFYDGDIQHSYFQSASNGGRQGMMESQRYPDDFDGIIAGKPAADIKGFSLDFIWNQQTMYPDAENLSRPALPSSKLSTLDAAIVTKCDALDGLEDGLISDPRVCNFNPVVDLPVCPEGADTRSRECRAAFLTTEIDTVQRIFDGPSNSNGQLFPGFLPSGEYTGVDFSGWMTDYPGLPSGAPNLQYAFAQDLGRYFIFDDPNWNLQDFDFESDLDRTAEAVSIFNATNPDITSFKESGGKLIIYHGWADPAINALSSIEYHERVVDTFGGRENVDDFMRLFLLPGVTHGGDGSGPRASGADWLTALEKWVEQDIPPDAVTTSGSAPSRSRPVCAYPSRPEWDGVGNSNRADSFSCVESDNHQALAGDVDGNSEVDFADFLILSTNFGSTDARRADGDLDGNGQVEFADFLILSESFGDTQPQALAAFSSGSPQLADLDAANVSETDEFFASFDNGLALDQV